MTQCSVAKCHIYRLLLYSFKSSSFFQSVVHIYFGSYFYFPLNGMLVQRKVHPRFKLDTTQLYAPSGDERTNHQAAGNRISHSIRPSCNEKKKNIHWVHISCPESIATGVPNSGITFFGGFVRGCSF